MVALRRTGRRRGDGEIPPHTVGNAHVDAVENGPHLLLGAVVLHIEGFGGLPLAVLGVDAPDQRQVGLRLHSGPLQGARQGEGLGPLQGVPGLPGGLLVLGKVTVRQRQKDVGVADDLPLLPGEDVRVGKHVGPPQAVRQAVLGPADVYIRPVTGDFQQVEHIALLIHHVGLKGRICVLKAYAGRIGLRREVLRHHYSLPPGADFAPGLLYCIGIAALQNVFCHGCPPYSTGPFRYSSSQQ